MNDYLLKLLNLCNPNKYTRWLSIIISYRIYHPYGGKTEIHHILPKSFGLGGETDINNLVSLSAREHFIVHKLMTKILKHKPYHYKMCKALSMFILNNDYQERIVSSRNYEYIRNLVSEANSFFQTGTKRTVETKEKMSLNNKAHLESTKDAIRKTKEERYGNPGYVNREQTNQTNLEKYGTISPAGNPEIVLKMKNTRLKKYGDANFVNPDKMKNTNLERYGTTVKANQKVTCSYCGHTTILSWLNRKHKDGMCLHFENS